MDAIEIPGREVFAAAAGKIEAAAKDAFPSREAGRELLNGMKDPWGNPVIYDLIDSSHARTSSAGPDKISKTRWDVGMILTKNDGAKPPGLDTWLGRRKAELGIRTEVDQSGFSRSEFCGGQCKLEGAAYFRFFTWSVLATKVLYIPFAFFYRPKTYLHD